MTFNDYSRSLEKLPFNRPRMTS